MSTGTSAAPRTESDAWRRDFFLLWTGNTISAVGSSMSYFLFPVLGLSITGSPARAALAGGLYALGRVILRIPAGVFVDGHNRRTTLLVANGVAGGLYILIAVSLLVDVQVFPVLLVGAFLTGVTSSVLDPAEQSAIRTIVPVTQLPSAISKNQARGFGAGLVGPPLAGLLFGIAHELPYVVDAFSYAVAAVCVAGIRTSLASLATLPEGERTVPGRLTHFVSEVKVGMKKVAGSPLLRATALYAVIANFAVGALFTAVTLKLLMAGVTPARVGLVDAVVAMAGLLGSLAGPWFIARVPAGWLACAAISLLSLGVLPTILTNDVLVVGASLAGAMLVAPAANSAVMSYVFATTPERMQGTVSATLGFLSNCIAPLGPVAAGALIAAFGPSRTLAIILAGTLCSMAPLLASKDVRTSGTPDQWTTHPSAPA